MLAVPVSLGPLFIQPTNSLAIWPGGKPLQRDPGDHFRDRHAGAVWAGDQRPQETHVLRALPGWPSRRWKLVCIMYAEFKRIEPGMDIGVDLGEEWEMAVAEIRMIMVAFRQSFDTSTLARNYIQSERASHSD